MSNSKRPIEVRISEDGTTSIAIHCKHGALVFVARAEESQDTIAIRYLCDEIMSDRKFMAAVDFSFEDINP